MKKLKIAVIGTGSISGRHIAAYLKNENVELYALCDVDGARLKAAGERWGVSRLYTNEEEMFAALPEIDAVSVCTWNGAHMPCAIGALRAGKHVLCEKPMALNAREAQQMLDTAKACNRKLMIGFVRRFGNDAQVMRDLIRDGTLGDIYYAKATYLRRNGNPGGWFGDSARSGGGPLIDLGVHVIDLTRYLMGDPKPVCVFGATFRKLGDRRELKDGAAYTAASGAESYVCDVEDLAAAFIRYENGAVLSVETSFCLNLKKDVAKVELFGTRAGMCLDPELEIFSDRCGYLTDTRPARPTALDIDEAFENEIGFFVDAIVHDRDVYPIAEDGIAVMKIIDAVYLSARTGKSVEL